MTALAHGPGVASDGDDPGGKSRRGARYDEVVANHAAALARLARAYEADSERCRDLQQEIHAALWESLAGFDGRCSLRTWVYRVAHNVACSHVMHAQRRRAATLVSLDELDALPADPDHEASTDRRIALERLFALIQRLNPLDRQVILLYLEGVDSGAVAEITGLSVANVNTKVHRIKKILASRFSEGGT
jgi:RNA polymerase sigma-70 factor (ECF subfamily)